MKTKKLLTGLLSTVLTLTLCQGFVATFANTDATDSTPTDPTEAIISKTIQMDQNTTPPTVDFTFDVTKVSVDDKSEEADLQSMPVIDDQTISFANGWEDQDMTVGSAEGGILTVTKSTINIVPAANDFPHAGKYVYAISEVDGREENMTYSNKEYKLNIFVKNEGNGLAIDHVAITTSDAEAPSGKSDVEPVDGKAVLSFVNTYVKTGAGDTDAKSLVVSNTVTGDLGDKTKEFAYTMTIDTISPLVTETEFQGTITRVKGNTETINLNTNGAEVSFVLKHGETLSFDTLPVGTTISVTQNVYNDYKTTSKVTSGGQETSVEHGATILISEKENKIDYVNARTATVPTGIISNNLPFFGLIVLALGGFVCLVALRRKYNS